MIRPGFFGRKRGHSGSKDPTKGVLTKTAGWRVLPYRRFRPRERQIRMTDPESEAADRIAQNVQINVDAMAEKLRNRNLYGAYEEVLVAERKLRAAINTDGEEMTHKRLELIGRLAWAESELVHGHSARAQDDLEGAEELAADVSEAALGER